MEAILQEERFTYLSDTDKAFMRAFNTELTRLGYDYGGKIGSGFCWGKHMVIYTKTGVKSKTVYARIYMRDDGIVLRLFLNDIDKHRAFIENAPAYIKEVFTGPFGDCTYDRASKDEKCQFRKSYTIDGRRIDKCNGLTFEFHQPAAHGIQDYLALFSEFFAPRRARAAQN